MPTTPLGPAPTTLKQQQQQQQEEEEEQEDLYLEQEE
jgi:hypothetical protein